MRELPLYRHWGDHSDPSRHITQPQGFGTVPLSTAALGFSLLGVSLSWGALSWVSLSAGDPPPIHLQNTYT